MSVQVSLNPDVLEQGSHRVMRLQGSYAFIFPIYETALATFITTAVSKTQFFDTAANPAITRL